MALAEEELGWVGDLAQALVRHFEDADLVGRSKPVLHRAQDAVVVAAFALKVKHRVDHVLDDARAGDLAFLGDMADQHDRSPRGFRIADHRLGGGAHLGDGAGRRIGHVRPQRLNRIEDHQVRPLAISDCRQDVLDIGLGGELDRRVGNAEPLRAQPDLGDRLFARDIDDPVAFCRECGGRLGKQRRLADAGIAADQKGRATHEAAAGGAVKFTDAGDDARRILDVARQRGQHHGAALAGVACVGRTRADAARRAFLDQRIPLAAGIALAGPALMHRSAILTDELDARFGHQIDAD